MLSRTILVVAVVGSFCNASFAQTVTVISSRLDDLTIPTVTPAHAAPTVTVGRLAPPNVLEIHQLSATQPAPLPSTLGQKNTSVPLSTLPDYPAGRATPPATTSPRGSGSSPTAASPEQPTATTSLAPVEPVSPPSDSPLCDPTLLTSPGTTSQERVWTNFEWLYWAASGQSLPAVATAAPVGTARSVAGVLSTPNSSVLYGGNRVNNDVRNGFRITGGLWLDDSHRWGVEGDFFFLGGSQFNYATASDGSQIIARPFFNPISGQPSSALVSYPGLLSGSLSVEARSSVIGGGVNAVHNLTDTAKRRIDLLFGYRYFNVSDEVEIRENQTALSNQPGISAGTQFQLADSFNTRNNFNGGVIGLNFEERRGLFFFGTRASVALGANYEVVDIAGATRMMLPGGNAIANPGGLLAQPSNIGHYSRSAFAVMPEIGIRAGIQLTRSARIYAGYNFLYLSNVVRAGDQIDLRVNPTGGSHGAIAGPALPQFTPHTTDFMINGVNAGLEFRF